MCFNACLPQIEISIPTRLDSQVVSIFHCTINMMTSSNGNIFRVTGSLFKGQWSGALMFSLICAWIKDWINNCEAGDLRHHRAHYDVIVMNRDKLVSVLGEQSFGTMYQKVEWQGCSKTAFKQHLKTHMGQVTKLSVLLPGFAINW